jgi:hypothetical protein
MKNFILFFVSLFLNFTAMTQTEAAGEYQLVGIHDMVAGIRLTEQGTFDFYYVYGAVDRVAKGTYTLEGKTIKLKSEKEAGKDFTIIKQHKTGKGYTIKVAAPNAMLAQYVKVIVFKGKEQSVEFVNKKGELHLSDGHIDRIYLQHELFPDIASEIKSETNDNNYFEVSLNPSLQMVSFKGVDFTLTNDTLTCLPNYFMPFENIRFVKH